MKRSYPKLVSARKRGRKKPPFMIEMDREEILDLLRSETESLAAEAALLIIRNLVKDEVAGLCGPDYSRSKGREHYRHGSQPGYCVIAGQKVPLKKPRVRHAKGGETELETYRLAQGKEAMPRSAFGKLLRGVSTRDYEGVIETAAEGFGVKKSSVSRQFVRATRDALDQLLARRFDVMHFPVLMIDGIEFSGEVFVVALGIDAKGRKHVLGLRQGATENASVCKELLSDLAGRGLDTSRPVLVVIDGGKALRKAVRDVFGDRALVQRCRVHKKRNIRDHVGEDRWPEIARQLDEAWAEPDYETALSKLKGLQLRLKRISPDAAASLKEGMEETLTVTRLGLTGPLLKSLASSNLIESALSVVRTATSRVKTWQDKDMRQRWCSAGLLRAEEKFRRLRGYTQMPELIRALERETGFKPELLDENRKAA